MYFFFGFIRFTKEPVNAPKRNNNLMVKGCKMVVSMPKYQRSQESNYYNTSNSGRIVNFNHMKKVWRPANRDNRYCRKVTQHNKEVERSVLSHINE